ncbi:MAG TPA: threonine/serine exporter family protein, partial [Vicinamibacteria bacterium]
MSAAAPPGVAADTARAFVLALGQALHAHGYAAHRLEESLFQVSRRLGLEGQFFSTPTAIFVSFGAGA